MNCRGFEGGLPALWRGEAIRPGPSAIGASLEEDCSLAVTFGIDRDDRAVVFEQDGRRVSEVLTGFTVDDSLTRSLCCQIELWDGVSAREVPG